MTDGEICGLPQLYMLAGVDEAGTVVNSIKKYRGVNESGYKKSVFSDILSICQ